jgi:glutaredoxin
MPVIKVEGENKNHKVFLYALSTCGWCKKTKQFLKDNSVEYEYLDVDKTKGEERKSAINDIKSRKVPLGFPIIIVDDENVIIGFKQNQLMETLGL